MNGVYKAGLILAIAPLAVGLAILTLLLTTRSEVFASAALYAFLPCVICVGLALICLVSYSFWEKAQIKARAVPALKLLGLILLAPVMVVCVFSASMRVVFPRQFAVTAKNSGKVVATDVVLKVGNTTWTMPKIGPGQQVTETGVPLDHGISFTANIGSQEISGTLKGSQTRRLGPERPLPFPNSGPLKFTASEVDYPD